VAPLVLPIFPLPDIALFPHTLLPLHVFEARYRAMVTDALVRARRIAVVGLRPGYETAYAGRPPVYAVAGAGEIVRAERLASGRYNIVVRGDSRIRIERELPADTLYRLVAATVLPEVPASGDAGPLVDGLRDRCRRLLTALGRPTEPLDRWLAAGEPGVVADRIASAVLPDPALRQELLETLEVDRRLARLMASLTRLVQEVTGGRGPAPAEG
jgi:hypothetical protein